MSFNQKAETPYVDVENTNIRSHLLSVKEKVDWKEWRALCFMFGEQDRIIRECRQKIRDLNSNGFRYFAGGPEFCFSTSSPLIAEKIISSLDEDRDDWTITDLENPCV